MTGPTQRRLAPALASLWLALAVLTVPAAAAPSPPAASKALEPTHPYRAAIVVEPSTMTVLYERNADESLPTASMVKMLTLLVVLDALEAGEVRWRTRVEISKNVERVRGSGVYLEAGEIHRVRDLVRATMIHSANDAAVALAEAVAGSEEEFVGRMRHKARALGLQQTEIHTPHGLPTSETGRPLDRMSARDLAIVGKAVMDRPELMELSSVRTAPFPGREFLLFNPNHLLRQYPHATGIKTGYTRQAGFCLTAAARRCDMDLIAVVIGCRSRNERFTASRKLLEDAFERYRLMVPVSAGEVLAQQVTVREGIVGAVPVVAARDARWVARWDEEPELETELVPVQVRAPVAEGEPVGTLLVKDRGRLMAEVPVVAGGEVLAPTTWQRLKHHVLALWASVLGRPA
jgi:serine-type D-Ala-D-Ala carboxypeptidase (penicillin-binding protein 5/6)